MAITYKTTKKLPPVGLFKLYESVGWTEGVKNAKKHGVLLAKVYFNSDLAFSAWDKKELVGVVRAITDKYAHGMIFGLAVDPRYQGQEIGKELILKCLKKYPNLQWSVEAEAPQAQLFIGLGFQKPATQYFTKGNSPV